jgi:tmRNA-binding protein
MSAYISNRKVRFDFEILETFEAGVVLFGYEVKAVRKGLGKLEGAHIVIHGNVASLVLVSPTIKKLTLQKSTTLTESEGFYSLKKSLRNSLAEAHRPV